MPQSVRLHVQLAPASELPIPGAHAFGQHRGGPGVLLRWLETTLGLQAEPVAATSRVTEYAALLSANPSDCYAGSLATDRWATAADLLRRRDALLLDGWDLHDHSRLPPMVRDMALAEAAQRIVPSEAERVASVLQALNNGQRLPPHTVVLDEPVEAWPKAWRPVLGKLNTVAAPVATPSARDGTALAAAQSLALGRDGVTELAHDASFAFAAARSRLAACQAIATMLAAEPQRLADTVISCEDADTTLLLDQALARLGLPTMGASRRTAAQPVLQLLPLALALNWEPVDPYALLEFLTLPVSPIPASAKWALARALGDQPGFGSQAWEDAWNQVTAPDADPGGRVAETLAAWFHVPRCARGQPLPTALVAERCGRVAQWALARAAPLEQRPDEKDLAMARALHAAASQAKAVGDLAQAMGTTITEAQLDRLVEAVEEAGADVAPLPALAGGPRLIRSLAELMEPCSRLIWLGTGTADFPPSRWTTTELQALQAAGIEVDDGARELRILRDAERRGLARVRERLLVVRLPQDSERRPHPLWQQLHLAMPKVDGKSPEPVYFEDLLTSGGRLGAWSLDVESHAVQPPHGRRATWQVAPGLLAPRATISASEMTDRLACPLKWTLGYAANLKPGSTAAISPVWLLRGEFCHQLLERVFAAGGPLPSPEEACGAVARCFDERLPLDAAPLALPAQTGEAMRLRAELVAATKVLVEALQRGGYRIAAIEAPLNATLLERPVNGRVDCIAVREDGEEAIIDFKYGRRRMHRDRLREGRAVQLAIYAAAREAETGRPVPGVAYLILKEARLLTPDGSPLEGFPPAWQERGAPGAQETWDRFARALQAAEGWLQSGEVPARPLQDEAAWPRGAAMVLAQDDDGAHEPCQFCSFGTLCGREAKE